MRDAQYLRAQAEFCLEVARQMSDHKMVENLQAEAARYHAEAVEIETEDHPGSNETAGAVIPKCPAMCPRESEIAIRTMTLDHRTKSELTSACSGTSSARSFRPHTGKIRRDLYRPRWWSSCKPSKFVGRLKLPRRQSSG